VRLTTIGLLAGLTAASGWAAIIPCAGGGINLGAASAYSCGGLTLDGFSIVNAGNVPSPLVVLVSGTFDTNTGFAVITFNPNLTVPANDVNNLEDIHFSFHVAGVPMNQVDLSVGGLNAVITETVCASPTTSAGTCSIGSPLVTIQGASGDNKQSPFFAATNSLYIFKDIKVEKIGDLTSFSQSFHEVVPEPSTYALCALGLVAFGLRRRRL
jgi:hypothetical protein